MNILLVHNEYGALSGEEVVFESYRSALSGMYNVETYIVSSSKTPTNIFNKIHSLFSGIFSFYHLFWFYRKVKKDNVKIVHFHNIYPWISNSAVIGASLAGAKVVFTLHNFKHICPSSTLTNEGKPYFNSLRLGAIYTVYDNVQSDFFKSFGYYLRFKSESLFRMFNRVDAFIHVSDAQKKIYVSHDEKWKASTVIPNFITSIDEDTFFNQRELKRKAGYPRVCFVGRFTTEKGVHKFLSVASACPNTNFFLIGSGQVECNDKNVTVLGKLERSDLLVKLAEMDVVIIHPTTFETFSLSGLEALCSGCKIIVNDNVGIAMFKNNSEHIIVENDIKVLTDDYFMNIINYEREFGVPSFSSQKVFLNKISKLYKEVLK
ncbi:glycosyltransferase family 4 protein [Vibrio owensii]|uniref:glycosyltransferase family 4 protein n=1 Tax=Vibrio owensii TaxID=696485 RepID=UPI00148D589D|nr:glycosyltransferase family 4 protein [Vibrio owensii]NOI71457.1 glycosyltransferase family 4 protein [Vibrio owensii]